MDVSEFISAVFILTGAVFMLISAIGLIRFPDFYIRNSASTKAATLGLGFILLGIILYYNNIEVLMKVSAIVVFIILIMPLAAHIIARAACKNKVPFWGSTNTKELEEYYKQPEQMTDKEKKEEHS